MSDEPIDPADLKLDSFSIHLAKPYLATLPLEARLALLPLARAQEAQRLKAACAGHPFYAKWTDADWERMAGSYGPACLIDEVWDKR